MERKGKRKECDAFRKSRSQIDFSVFDRYRHIQTKEKTEEKEKKNQIKFT